MKKETNVILQILRNLVKGLGSLMFHLLKMVYLIIQWFDNTIAKLFMKLPRLIKVVLIYAMITSVVFTILVLTKTINVNITF